MYNHNEYRVIKHTDKKSSKQVYELLMVTIVKQSDNTDIVTDCLKSFVKCTTKKGIYITLKEIQKALHKQILVVDSQGKIISTEDSIQK